MSKKKRAVFIVVWVALMVIVLVAALLVGGSGESESIKVVMRDAVLHGTNRISLLGWKLNPMFGAAAMSLSSFCVVSNALRLNLFKLHDAGKDKKINRHSKHKEETTMVKTMKIEGMMCGHCEAAVKKALEAIDGVASAEGSHTAPPS